MPGWEQALSTSSSAEVHECDDNIFATSSVPLLTKRCSPSELFLFQTLQPQGIEPGIIVSRDIITPLLYPLGHNDFPLVCLGGAEVQLMIGPGLEDLLLGIGHSPVLA